MTPEQKRGAVWQTVTGTADAGPRIDPRYVAKYISSPTESAHFETARDAYIERAINENLKDCTLIGEEQGFMLRCMVYGVI